MQKILQYKKKSLLLNVAHPLVYEFYRDSANAFFVKLTLSDVSARKSPF